jgi:hypothetical protein
MKVALLGKDDLYLGQTEIDPSEFDSMLHLDSADYGGNCDLTYGPGTVQYYWDREAKRFEPVNQHQAEVARDVQRIIEFAAAQAGKVPEIDDLVKKHFPAEHRRARLKNK